MRIEGKGTGIKIDGNEVTDNTILGQVKQLVEMLEVLEKDIGIVKSKLVEPIHSPVDRNEYYEEYSTERVNIGINGKLMAPLTIEGNIQEGLRVAERTMDIIREIAVKL